jgi:hypothetical protein
VQPWRNLASIANKKPKEMSKNALMYCLQNIITVPKFNYLTLKSSIQNEWTLHTNSGIFQKTESFSGIYIY